MTNNQDARPFVDLRKDAKEFRSKFDEDILKCISFLDTKITALICDPDSLGTPSRGVKQNALVEFSKSKYDIYVGVKSLVNDMEREWMKYISEMKKLFIENVEIFLAGTKLEVKLPSNEFQSSPTFSSPLRSRDDIVAQNKQSKDFQLRNDNEISDDESDSEDEAARMQLQSEKPIAKGRTTVMLKRHAVEPKAKKVVSPKMSYVAMETGGDESDSSDDNEEMDLKTSKSKSTPRGRAGKRSLSSSDLDSSQAISKATGRSRKDKSLSLSDLDTSLSSPRTTRSRPESEARMNTSSSRLSGQTRNETRSSSSDHNASQPRSTSGRFTNERKLSKSPVKRTKSSNKIQKENEDEKQSHNTSRSSSRTSGRLTNERKSSKSPVNRTKSPNKTQKENKDEKQDLDASQSGSRRSSRSMNDQESSCSPVKRTETANKSQNENKDKKQVTNAPQLGSSKKKGRLRKGENLDKSPVLQEKSSNILLHEDSDKEKESDISRSRLRGHKDKQPAKNTPRKAQPIKNTPKKAQESEENQPSLKENKRKQPVKNTPKKAQGTEKKSSASEETSENESSSSVSRSIPLRGRSSAKITRSSPRKGSTTDESDLEHKKEGSRSVLKARRGGTPAKHNLNPSTVSKNSPKTRTSEDTEEDSNEAEQNRSRRGKTPQRTKTNSSSDKLATRTTLTTRAAPARGGRKAVQDKTPKQPPAPKSNLMSSSDSSEYAMQKSPKKVTFTECDINDDLDVYSPDIRISKPTPRRKTLLPTLDTIKMLSAEESPKVGRSSAKRKTIAGTSDLARISPPKRLKVSDSKRGVPYSQDEDDADDDNLLESDGNYSEWIPLKSIDGKIPTSPAVYEVKVWRAKKTAFIGFAESLRQKLTLHKLRQNSGHKHLDKFIERNMDDIQIRYEVVTSVNNAKNEVKKRIKSFVAQYKTTPAYD